MVENGNLKKKMTCVFGKPGTTNITQSPGKKGGYKRFTEIGEDSRETREIHATDHGQPNVHSDLYTHNII